MPFGENAKVYENLGITKRRVQELLDALNSHQVEDLKQETKLIKFIVENHCQVIEEVIFVSNLVGQTTQRLRCAESRLILMLGGLFKDDEES